MRQLCPNIRAERERDECLDEKPRLQLPVEEIADAAADGDRHDDHHRRPDRLQKRHSEHNHEGDLYVRCRADTERAREHTAEKANRQSAEAEPPPRQEFLPHRNLPPEPLRLIDAQVEERGT